MQDKNVVIVGAGLLVIMVMVVLITWGINEYASLSANAASAVDSLVAQQKDMLINKLSKELKAKQSELDNAKTELASIKEKIGSIKTDLNNAAVR
jgi:septal ring factor EnvC (AmiA/AmiB activator)